MINVAGQSSMNEDCVKVVGCKRCLIYKRQLSMLSIHAIENDNLNKQLAKYADLKRICEEEKQKRVNLETHNRDLKEQLQQSNSKLVREMARCDDVESRARGLQKELDEVTRQYSELEIKHQTSSNSRVNHRIAEDLFKQKSEADLRSVHLQIEHAEAYVQVLQQFANVISKYNLAKLEGARSAIDQSLTVWRTHIESLRLAELNFDRSVQKQKASFDPDMATRFLLVTSSSPHASPFDDVLHSFEAVLAEVAERDALNATSYSSQQQQTMAQPAAVSAHCSDGATFQASRYPHGIRYIPPPAQATTSMPLIASNSSSDSSMMLVSSSQNPITMSIPMVEAAMNAIMQPLNAVFSKPSVVLNAGLPSQPQIFPNFGNFYRPRFVAGAWSALQSPPRKAGYATTPRFDPPASRIDSTPVAEPVVTSQSESPQQTATSESTEKENVVQVSSDLSDAALAEEVSVDLLCQIVGASTRSTTPDSIANSIKSSGTSDNERDAVTAPKVVENVGEASNPAEGDSSNVATPRARGRRRAKAAWHASKAIKEVVDQLRPQFPDRSEKQLLLDLKRFRAVLLTDDVDRTSLTVSELVDAVVKMINQDSAPTSIAVRTNESISSTD